MRWLPSFVLVALAGAALASCSVAPFVRGEPGTDLSRVRVGAEREEIEAILGAPRREWQTSLGIRYRLYAYDAGAPPSPGDAAAMVFLDIISLGLSEPIVALGKAEGRAVGPAHIRALMAVSFGSDNRAIAVFERVSEFSVLPEDGRAPADTTGIIRPAP